MEAPRSLKMREGDGSCPFGLPSTSKRVPTRSSSREVRMRVYPFFGSSNLVGEPFPKQGQKGTTGGPSQQMMSGSTILKKDLVRL